MSTFDHVDYVTGPSLSEVLLRIDTETGFQVLCDGRHVNSQASSFCCDAVEDAIMN